MDEYNDSIQECRDAISSLYEQQRDLIRQKLDNILSYYSDMDSYLSSITSKILDLGISSLVFTDTLAIAPPLTRMLEVTILVGL